MLSSDQVSHLRVVQPRPQPKRKWRLLLITVMIASGCVVFFQSPYSRVSEIVISGQDFIDEAEIKRASGIRAGEDHFFGLWNSTIEQNILSQISASQGVEVTKDFPGKVNIAVQLKPRVAHLIDADGNYNIIFNDGSSWPIERKQVLFETPILTGWSNQDPNMSRLCMALSEIPVEHLTNISEIIPSPSVSYPDRILIYMRSQFEVYTTISYMNRKLIYVDAYIASLQQNPVVPGIITLLEVDSYAPFDPEQQPLEAISNP